MQLFQPNNLSVLKPEFTPISNSLLIAEVAAILKEHYRLSSSQLRVSQPAGVNVSGQNLVVDAGVDRYFLKRRNVIDGHRLFEEAKLAFDLGAMGLKVPRVIQTSDGKYLHAGSEWCCVVYSFEEGSYFSGRGRELDSAAEAYGLLTRATRKLFNEDAELTSGDHFLEELEPLLGEAMQSSRAGLAKLISENCETVLNQLQDVTTKKTEIDARVLPLHLDYHPLNLLMRDGELSCILDFEHLKVYPVVAGVGFAGYKLIRQALVHEDIHADESANPTLVTRWLDGWRQTFPDLLISPEEFGIGAAYRVLFLIHLILDAFLKHGDERHLYDLEKQITSLYEIEAIVANYSVQPL